jgi:hypothetical protein
VTVVDHDTLVVNLRVSGLPRLESFRFQVSPGPYDGSSLLRVSRRGATGGWTRMSRYYDAVGGYTTGYVTAVSPVDLLQMRLYPVKFGTVAILYNFVDDLQGVQNVSITWGGGSIPVLFSAFDAIADINGVRVNWKLSGDETAESYSLWRWTEANGARTRVADGRVSGTSGTYRDAKVEPATVYHYDMIVRSTLGNEFVSPVASVTTPGDAGMTLGQNHPNPFNPQTSIPYTLPGGSQTSHVRLFILDVSGGIVRRLVNESQSGGSHTALWNGDDDRGTPVSSGVYFYVLDVDGRRLTKKLVLLK